MDAVAVGRLVARERIEDRVQRVRVVESEPLDPAVAQAGLQRLREDRVGKVHLGFRGSRAKAVRPPRELGQQAALADTGLALDRSSAPEPLKRLVERGELAL